MEYREFCKTVAQELGEVYWPVIGKLYQKYSSNYLVDCLLAFPSYKKNLSPFSKTRYFASICRNNVKEGDVIVKNKNVLKIEKDDLSV